MSFSKDLKIMILISIFLLMMGTFKLSEKPKLESDEVWHGILSVNIIKYGIIKYIIDVPFLPTYYHGPFHFLTCVPFIYIFGLNVFSLRFQSVILGISTANVLYLFVKEYYDEKVALFSSIALIVNPSFFYVMRVGHEYISYIFFLVLSLYSLSKFSKSGDDKFFYLLFLSLGLGLISKLNILFFIISLFITIKLYPKKISIKRKPFFFAIIIFLVAVYPLICFNVKNEFIHIRHFLNKFPSTERADLSDVSSNLVHGLTILFPNMLEGSREEPIYSLNFSHFPLFLLIVLLSLIWLSLKNFIKIESELNFWKDINFRKDFFIIINIIFLLIFTSTVTISWFETTSFFILIPFCSIVVGRVFSQTSKESLIVLILVGFYFVGFYYFYLFFTNPSYVDECHLSAKKAINTITKINHSKFVIDLEMGGWSYSFDWFLNQRKIYNESIIYLERSQASNFLKNNVKYKNILYIFPEEVCITPFTEETLKGQFLNAVSTQNKTAVKELEIYSPYRHDKLVYEIYRAV